MDPGEFQAISTSIRESTRGVAGEIRVHITRRWPEHDPTIRARRLLADAGMSGAGGKAGVLLYVNSRARVFTIVGNDTIHRAAGPAYWKELALALRDDLRSTSLENAIILAVRTLGATLLRYFPEK